MKIEDCSRPRASADQKNSLVKITRCAAAGKDGEPSQDIT